jgi:ubiquinone/menaquinone biosynthesis C-methylase UbiE
MADRGLKSGSGERAVPPAHLRIVGQALTGLIARAPFVWPVLRTPIRRFFDRIAPQWDERTEVDSPERLAPLAAALDYVAEPPARAVDLGTGTGAAALMLARRYPQARVVGVDISEPMIAAARAKLQGTELGGRVEFDVEDIAALPYGDEAFDLVAQVSTPVFFDEIVRVLAPSGYVAIVSSLGSATPFHTPEPVLERGFRRRGLEVVARGEAGPGTFFVARRT